MVFQAFLLIMFSFHTGHKEVSFSTMRFQNITRIVANVDQLTWILTDPEVLSHNPGTQGAALAASGETRAVQDLDKHLQMPTWHGTRVSL
jgi:hypothetical protein